MTVDHRSSKSLSNENARRILEDSRKNGQSSGILSSDLEEIGPTYDEWASEQADNVVNDLIPVDLGCAGAGEHGRQGDDTGCLHWPGETD